MEMLLERIEMQGNGEVFDHLVYSTVLEGFFRGCLMKLAHTAAQALSLYRQPPFELGLGNREAFQKFLVAVPAAGIE